MLALLRSFSWQELRHHPWRSAAGVVAVMLGVALAFAVHLINQSALGEFAGALRSAGAQPDLELRGSGGRVPEELFAQVARNEHVALAAPVLELQTSVQLSPGDRRSLRVVGLDPLLAPALSPSWMPVPASAERFALFAPGRVFLNPAAQALLGPHGSVRLQAGAGWVDAQVAGTVSAGGPPLAVMDIAAAQDLFGRQGELTRIDVRLRTGSTAAQFRGNAGLPDGIAAADPGAAAQRVDSLSRAYRVNLTVLALVALFTGSFLVYSVLALSVARRSQQLALLGVLGLTAGQRLRLVLAEAVVLGGLGSALGLALGTALAAIGLARLGGDLGGGYFPGVAPHLQWSTPAALAYGLLGIAAAAAGGWLPARSAQGLPLAQALKGLGSAVHGARASWAPWLLLAAGGACAFVPPIDDLPLAAYASVGLLLVGGITALPVLVALVYDRIAPLVAHRALPMLAVERARRVRETAAVAVSGVVAALSLAVALTVMVASFRESVSRWLDLVLPADLYVRTGTSAASADSTWLPAGFDSDAARVPGVARVAAQRLRPLLLDPARPPVTLLARDIGDAATTLPMVQGPVAVPAGTVPVYVTEAVVDLYGARPGEPVPLLSAMLGTDARFVVAGVWRDYVRQTGAIAIERAAYVRLTRDERVNEMAVWLSPGADAARVQAALREAAARAGAAGLVEFASARDLRLLSLRIFDRSFAVTYWLQAVAIGIGLFGIAASFSAQVLARRKEFGLLAHLGLTRGQILRVVAGEGAVWTAIGAIAGLVLGLAVSVVLVHVVNPQSFHWTMDLLVPWLRLALLCTAVVVAGTFTAWAAGRAAASRDAVLAVKEDW